MNAATGATPFPVPYAAIARLIERRSITLFLGAAASLVNASPSMLPDGRQLSLDLAKLGSYPGNSYDPLTKVSQYLVEYAGDRDLILDYIKSRFHDEIPSNYQCSITDFLGRIPLAIVPKLIVTTNYDTLIEKLFEQRGSPYICISHILGRSKYTGRLVVYEKLCEFSKDSILTRAEAEDLIQDRISSGLDFTVIYKMHGSAISYIPRASRDGNLAGGLNSIVLTEQDYIDFLDKNTTQRLPIQVQQMLYQSQFLFLGYSLGDWNFRLLLHRLRDNQAGADTKHWACLLHSDPVEAVFWQKRGVNIHYVSLDNFLEELQQHLPR
jgi:hypothetical protein